MEANQLAAMYSISTLRMHDAVTEAYEALHTDDGEPIESRDHLRIILTNLRAVVESEIDLAMTALEERLHNDDKQ